jgi:hypothetical protein
MHPKLQKPCTMYTPAHVTHLSVRALQVGRREALLAYEAALDAVRAENEAAADAFLRGLARPLTPAERDACARAQAGLDVPEDNPLRLRPHSAAVPDKCDLCSGWCSV